jgi:hypothetical protein
MIVVFKVNIEAIFLNCFSQLVEMFSELQFWALILIWLINDLKAWLQAQPSSRDDHVLVLRGPSNSNSNSNLVVGIKNIERDIPLKSKVNPALTWFGEGLNSELVNINLDPDEGVGEFNL